MSYVRSNGTVGRPPTTLEYYSGLGLFKGVIALICDIFWGIIDLFSLFFGNLFDPLNKPIPKRPKPPPTPIGSGTNSNRGANIRGIPKADSSCAGGG